MAQLRPSTQSCSLISGNERCDDVKHQSHGGRVMGVWNRSWFFARVHSSVKDRKAFIEEEYVGGYTVERSRGHQQYIGVASKRPTERITAIGTEILLRLAVCRNGYAYACLYGIEWHLFGWLYLLHYSTR